MIIQEARIKGALVKPSIGCPGLGLVKVSCMTMMEKIPSMKFRPVNRLGTR
jgi:hypothetical protein